MEERLESWHSPSLRQEMKMLVFGHGGIPIILFPTSMGRYYQNKDFHLIDAAAWFIDNGIFKIYCPDSVDEQSWYNRNIHPADKARRHIQYDAYIRDEVLPMVRQQTGHSRIVTAGCSFGAYHATNFGFKYPGSVAFILNMGGAYDIRNHMHGYYDENVYYNNPPDFIPGLIDDNIYRMGVVFGAGEHDFCLQANYRMSHILNEKGVRHWLDVVPGGNHDWPVWREMFPRYLGRIIQG